MMIVSLLFLLSPSYIEAFVSTVGRHQRSPLKATVGDEFDFSPFNPSAETIKKSKTKQMTKEESDVVVVEPLKNETCQGIGGKDGVSYDVNKLKTNLVQRCVASYKQQLWDELGNPNASQEAIEAMLSSIVQSNPVSTTTDSNLLEGKWAFVFSSAKPAKVLMDDARFKIGYKSIHPGEIIGSLEGGTRSFALENVDPTQDPYVTDNRSWGAGIVRQVRHYRVAALTRTSLDLDIFRSTWKLLGYPLWRRRYRSNRQTLQAMILYVDCDLCVCVDHGLDEPFTVYTKSPAWVARTEQLKRRWKKVRSRMERVKSRIMKDAEDDDGPIGVLQDNTIWLEYDKDDTKIKVVKLGEIGPPDERAWEGDEDPFNNLAADDRQALLKGMEIGQIETIGNNHLLETKKLSNKKLSLQRQKTFKKPS